MIQLIRRLPVTYSLFAAALLVILSLAIAKATPPNTIMGSVAICSAYNPLICTEPTADGTLNTSNAPSSAANAGTPPIATPLAAASLVLKASAGNLYGIEATAGASAGYLLIFDATSAPTDGTVTPKYCKNVPANTAVELAWIVPASFTTGITAVFSTTGCFTKTASATAFISGMVK